MSFEMNKIVGAFLGAMILAMVCGFIADGLVSPRELAKPAYMVAGVTESTATTAAQQPAGPAPIGPYLAKADAAKGKQIATVCTACHTFAKGEPNKIGPNLYNVYGGPVAEDRGGYPFSDALKKHDKQIWDADLLNDWLAGPQKFAPGTKMTFAGLDRPQQRADVIAFLDSLSPKPKPLVSHVKAAAKPPAPAAAAAPTRKVTPTPSGGPSELEAALATASAAKGKADAMICSACHTFEKGQPNRIGPNLWGVFDGPIAEDRGGFAFSDALKKHDKEKWTAANLNQWLTDPAKFAPGTKMTFAGFPSEKERADVIAFLDSLSDHPLPLAPKPGAAAAKSPPPAKK
jgi:cytochrome c